MKGVQREEHIGLIFRNILGSSIALGALHDTNVDALEGIFGQLAANRRLRSRRPLSGPPSSSKTPRTGKLPDFFDNFTLHLAVIKMRLDIYERLLDCGYSP